MEGKVQDSPQVKRVMVVPNSRKWNMCERTEEGQIQIKW
jgi:hypothetical protein